MAKKKKTAQKKSTKPSVQAHLPIAEIKDGVLVMKDGTLRSVLLTSSINFSLKSEDEQTALISAYVGFLNSLEYPLQIVVQSRRLRIQPYLDTLREFEQNQQNELLRLQISDYRAFVKELVDLGQIMTKRFYVVVPYDPASNKKKSFWVRVQEVLTPTSSLRLKKEKFLKRKEDLELRLRQVVSGLEGMGLQVARLDTQSLIELYYGSYNPDIAFNEPLSPLEKIQVEQTTF